MKKTIILFVCLVMVMSCISVDIFAMEKNEASTYLLNASKVTTSFNIDENGNAIVNVGYRGIADVTTNAVITVKIQKRFLLIFWQDVDGGEWTDYASGEYYSTSHSVSVKSGTYRATVEYTIYGTGGAPDVITEELKAEY